MCPVELKTSEFKPLVLQVPDDKAPVSTVPELNPLDSESPEVPTTPEDNPETPEENPETPEENPEVPTFPEWNPVVSTPEENPVVSTRPLLRPLVPQEPEVLRTSELTTPEVRPACSKEEAPNP